MNATPRPWIYDYERRTIRKIEKGTGSKDDPIQYGMTLASLQQDLRMQPKQAEVNGELIVRAVNSFDAMKEALEVAQKELRFANLTEEGTQKLNTPASDVLETIQAALALGSRVLSR